MSWWKFWDRGKPDFRGSRSRPRQSAPGASRGLKQSPVEDRSKVFDPALKQFDSALVPGEPVTDSIDELESWREVQRDVMGHVLRTIAESRHSEHLVLRGSALMCEWFGDAARPPKDLDFVVVPETRGIRDSRATAMIQEIITRVTSVECPGVTILPGEVSEDDIWTYDRVPGTRIVFRWTADGLPWGSTQLDFVFHEPLPEPPQWLHVSLDGGPPAHLQVASKPLSLAWKLMWLHSDLYPRGKDLYDAMLLAEATELPRRLFETVFELTNETPPSEDRLTDFYDEELEWIGFERPDANVVDSWTARLHRALYRQAQEQEGI